MAGCCEECRSERASGDERWRRVLWIVLILNASMFALEIGAGLAAHSASLKADALDFLGDSANYAISLAVSARALEWRARAALLKGGSLLVLGLWVLGSTAWMALAGVLPHATIMGGVGGLALGVNFTCALLLWWHRDGDANRRSVWICSRNDAIGNVAVVIAALGVLGTDAGWPDVAVAAILAALAIGGGWEIVRAARRELRMVKPSALGRGV